MRQVNELLANSTTEPSSGEAGSYSIVPKHMDSLHLILNNKQFNHYVHITAFKMATIIQVWVLFQKGDYALSINLKDTYLHIPLVDVDFSFCWLNLVVSW